MKVVLLRDVKGIGRSHETVEAADGYALNYLLPKKLAVAATSAAVKQASVRKAHVQERQELDAKLLAQNFATLAEARIVVTAKANEQEHLYDAVGEREVASAIREQTQVELPEHAIRLEKPIKALGTYDVPLAAGDLFGKTTLVVEKELDS